MIAANDQDAVPIAAELDLIAYLDGELDETKIAEVEAKLEADPEYRARLHALDAVGDFMRDDAARIYDKAKVDSIVDQVMSQLSSRGKQAKVAERVSALPMSVLPPSSVLTRKRKNSVIWVAFGTVTAAAAALFVYVSRQSTTNPSAVATQTQTPTPPETVAVKSPGVVPSNDLNTPPPSPPPIVEESRGVEVEDLEVAEGATVIYADHQGEGASAVVWVNTTK